MEKTPKKKERFFANIASKKLELFVFFLVVSLTVVVFWPFFTTTVEAGHVGAYYSRFFGGTLTDRWYKEGLRLVLPWDKIISYDSRAQSREYNITALSRGGLKIDVNMAVIWYIKKENVGELHKAMGPDYADTVIDPSVISVVRSVIGSYEQGRLYDGDPLQLQEDVMKLLEETLVSAPFYIHSILIREVKLPQEMQSAISEKFVSEQNVLAERYRVLEAIERYKKSFVDAEGVRITQSVVNEGMSEAYLRYMGIQATLELAKSENAKLVIIGDKDGLPLILNPDTMEVSTTLPDGLSPDEYIQKEGERANNLVDTYNRMQDSLDQMSDVLGELMESFPHADESIDDSTELPQVTEVPTIKNEKE